MKFLVVFVTLAAVAFGKTTWTLNELSEAIQDPGTNPILLPYLENALNKLVDALHSGIQMESINVALPYFAEYTLPDVTAALKDPHTDPAHIPYLEAALDQLMDAIFAGVEEPTVTVILPPVGAGVPDFVDVWPVQTPEEVAQPEFIDVWPVQIPEGVAPVAPAPVETEPSSPLVQIIVNVQKTSDVIPEGGDVLRPVPVQYEEPLPGWGNFI